MWEKKSGKIVYKNPRFSVVEDQVVFPDGNTYPYYYLTSGGGVFSIPYNGKKFLMVREYRYPLGKYIWSFPAGLAETEDYQQDAIRELKEETGFEAKKWTSLGHWAASTGLTDQIVYLFLAEELVEGEHSREAGELDMEHKFFSLEEIDAMFLSGELFGSSMLTALYVLKNYLKIS